MLEKAIEIEGLMRIIRDGDPMPETYVLLKTKTAALAQDAATLDLQFETLQPQNPNEKPHMDFIMAPPPSAPETPEVVFANIASSAPQEEELELEEEDDIILTFEDPHDDDDHEEESPDKPNLHADPDKESQHQTESEQEQDAEDGEPEEAIEVETESEETESEEAYTYEDTEDTENTFEDTDDTFDSEPDETKHASETFSPIESEGEVDLKVVVKPKRAMKLKSAFSLNDRFLYARELFKGNMKMFDSTLEHIEGMEDFPAIERYFYKDLEWNREDSRVAAFMEIVKSWCC